MKVNAKELHRLFYNAILFTDKKSATGGVAEFLIGDESIVVIATDDHVAIQDSIGDKREVREKCYLSLEQMKATEKNLREQEGDAYFEVGESEEAGPDDLWDMVRRMLSLEDFRQWDNDNNAGPTWALNPDRLRKFSLLKPGDYPIDMRYGYDNWIAREVIAFKAGPTLRGVLAPLDREIVREKFGAEADRVMW